MVNVTDPYGRILGFLDRSRYFSIKYLLSCTHEAEWTPFQTHYFFLGCSIKTPVLICTWHRFMCVFTSELNDEEMNATVNSLCMQLCHHNSIVCCLPHCKRGEYQSLFHYSTGNMNHCNPNYSKTSSASGEVTTAGSCPPTFTMQ
jgi:hypothetical protein